jgi:hypothetical protein
MRNKFKQKIISENILNSYIIYFFSHLDIFSLDNDSFDFRNVD